MSIGPIVDVISSSLGVVPILVCLTFEKYVLFFFTSLSCIIAVLHSSILLQENSDEIYQYFVGLDSIASVFLTICCSFYLKMNRTFVGSFRILWLVTLVSSSATYVFFTSVSKEDYIPNDVSLIAIGISVILMILSALYVRCRTTTPHELNQKHQVAESLLVVGALILRFEKELEEFVKYKIGFLSWHFCSWVSVILCAMV